jgi:dihydroxy-acid dehydratase
MTRQDSSTYWKKSRVELRAAGFDPDRAAQDQRRGHHRQRLHQRPSLQQPGAQIADLLVELLASAAARG